METMETVMRMVTVTTVDAMRVTLGQTAQKVQPCIY